MRQLHFKKKQAKRILYLLLFVLIMFNLVAYFHAHKFTHFVETNEAKTKKELSSLEKLNVLMFGINNPRPKNKSIPEQDYVTFYVESSVKLECWSIDVLNPKGTIILFHGYGGEKSSLLDKSKIFNELGYNTVLVDFSGSGGSESNKTTLGYFESKQVFDVYKNVSKKEIKNIYLFGTSMGAVAIMKALAENEINAAGVILECPFGTMYETVVSRFEIMNVPAFPMADLLMFWGGVQNGFWAYNHNPTEYAKQIETSTLLMYGAKDKKVSFTEIKEIFENLKGKKELKVYKEVGHENYLNKYEKEWRKDTESFLKI